MVAILYQKRQNQPFNLWYSEHNTVEQPWVIKAVSILKGLEDFFVEMSPQISMVTNAHVFRDAMFVSSPSYSIEFSKTFTILDYFLLIFNFVNT